MISRTFCLILAFIFTFASSAAAKAPSLDKWKPSFNPSGAKYRCIISNVSHPILKGVYTGFAMRDEMWRRTNEQIYIDFKPMSILGGEESVLTQLESGVIQGMGISSIGATNLGPRFGLLNLPYLVNTSTRLEKFAQSGDLFDHFMMAMDQHGIIGLDITGFGAYGWATTTPVRSLSDAKRLKIRTAHAALNRSIYKEWGIPSIDIPWPDVSVALKKGVIDGLDHTPTVCNITRKFDVAKYYTHLDYSQGLFIWIFNKAWINRLPRNLRETFRDVVRDVCADMRRQAIQQDLDQINTAKKKGIEFIQFSDSDLAQLKRRADKVHNKYRHEINKLYPGDRHRPRDFLQEVKDYMGYDATRYLASDRNSYSAAPMYATPAKKIYTPKAADKTPPEILITSHDMKRGIGVVQTRKKAIIKGRAIDSSGIVEVLVDSREAFVDENGNFQSSVYLKYGDNRILISAMDRFENVSTRQLKITREGTAAPPPVETRSNSNRLQDWYNRQYALIIGVDRYKSSEVDILQNAVNDAKAIGSMFKKMGFEVTELYNAEAQKARILRSFSAITKKMRQPDSFVFYFAGHGQGFTLANGERVGYILPYDADVSLKNVDLIQYDSECIPISTIKKYSKNMKAKHIALMFDSCFSGLAMKRSARSVSNIDIEYYNDLLSRKVINILTAGDDQPVSDGTRHSPFTRAILYGLERKALDMNDRDGFVTFNQLAVYVKEKVEKATGRRQRPQFDNLSLEDGDFIFKVR